MTSTMRVVMFLLKSIVGLLAAIGFLIVAGIVASALVWQQLESLATGSRQDIPPATILTLDLAAGIIETRPDNPLARASLGNVLVMRDVLEALEAAGRDPRVRGLMLRAGRGSLGLASAQEGALGTHAALAEPAQALPRLLVAAGKYETAQRLVSRTAERMRGTSFEAAFAIAAASERPSFLLAGTTSRGSIPLASRNLDARLQDVQPLRS